MGKNKRIWHDHLGNEFESKQSLCDNYEINVRAFEKRLQRGCSLEDALTTPVPHQIIVIRKSKTLLRKVFIISLILS